MRPTQATEPRVRLFIALDLPDEIRRGIARWGTATLAGPSLRRVPEEALHITLAFLGDRPESEISPIAALIGKVEALAPAIALSGPVPAPPRRPRVLALPVASSGSVALRAMLEEKLVKAGLFVPEKRDFWPHVTVARVRSPTGVRPGRDAAGYAAGPLPDSLRASTVCRRIALYRSITKSAGAEYIPLAQVELPEQAAVR